MAGIFSMRKRRSFWYAHAHVNLVCAGAGHFGMRTRRLIFHAQVHVKFSCAHVIHFLLYAGLFGTILLKLNLKHIFNVFFPENYSYFLNNLYLSFFYLKLVLLKTPLIILEGISCPLITFGQPDKGKLFRL